MANVLAFRSAEGRERLSRRLRRLREDVRGRSRPIRRHIADHAYTLAGFGCISAASFVHSVFTGLLVTGILLLVFEFKVSD